MYFTCLLYHDWPCRVNDQKSPRDLSPSQSVIIHMNNKRTHGLSQERYAELDAELEAMWTRLIEMAVEIDKAADTRNGQAYQAACHAADAVSALRHYLSQTAKSMKEG